MDTALLPRLSFGRSGACRAIGWASGRLYSVIFEIREDADGEYYHLITLWKATKEERKLYEENFQT